MGGGMLKPALLAPAIVALLITVCPNPAWAQCACSGTCRTYSSGGWLVHQSENFQICSSSGHAALPKAAAEAEALRRDLSKRWLGSSEKTTWSPRCQIVLHRTAAGYLRAVPGGSQSIGSSLVEMDGPRIVARRIDIRADRADWLDGALPHELTHVILADLFVDQPIARWADEGMAVLADIPAKQDQHLAAFHDAFARHNSLRLVQLVGLQEYPAVGQGVFYGQSVSLVRFLVEQGTPQQFTGFLRQAADSGYDAALRDSYRIDGIADLEDRWKKHVAAAADLGRKKT